MGSGGGEAGEGAFAEHVSFQLGEGGHHGEEELPFPGGGVSAGQPAGEDAEPDAALVQIIGEGEDLLDRSAETIELPDAQRVTVA